MEIRSLRALEPDQKRDVLDELRYANMHWACLSAVPIPSVGNTAVVRRSKKATASHSVVPLITGCILARNEERNIEAAIESLRACSDEILVIDNESDDETAAIALRCGARVVTAPRCNGNFDGARNLREDGLSNGWQGQMAQLLLDWQFYYDRSQGRANGRRFHPIVGSGWCVTGTRRTSITGQ